jgi:polyisoprenoid-binding protein YceI
VTRRPLILLAVLAAVAVGGYIAYDQFLRGDEVPPLTLPSASPTGSSEPSATGSSESSSTTGTGSQGELAGEWAVTDGSIVGYRVREKLASLPAQSDAVGRTSDVTGAATLAASGDAVTVIAASFEADLSTLASDDGRRDRRIQQIGLESSRFPTASFTLTSPIEVPAAALNGEAVDVTLVGDLTIHGVTKSVSIAVAARLNGDQVEVQGSLTFAFSDFGMTPPNIAGFVTVEDDATLEFLLVLARG